MLAAGMAPYVAMVREVIEPIGMKTEFGPNQDDVVALLKRLKSVDQPQALFLAGLANDDAARHAAREAMLELARTGGREAVLGTRRG